MSSYPRKDYDQLESEKLAATHARRGTEMHKPTFGTNKINVSGLEKSLTSVDERKAGLSNERPNRDRTTSGQGRSPGKTGARGGGPSAERLRKGDNDAYEDRIDEMHHNIGK